MVKLFLLVISDSSSFLTILIAKDAPSELNKGRLEGWVRIRIAGQTDWKKLYMVISSASNGAALNPELSRTHSRTGDRSTSPTTQRGSRRISTLFSRDNNTNGGGAGQLPLKPTITLYSGNKPKERKSVVLTIREVTQAFAVYPERPELINVSPLIKLEGQLGEEITAGGMRNREAWTMVMPEIEGKASHAQAGEMLKWVIGEWNI